MFSLFPKDKTFIIQLNQLAEQTFIASQKLSLLMHSTNPTDAAAATATIHAAKAEAKRIANEVTGDLCRTFVTPFDREDIQQLADHLYKIPKIIEKIVDRLELHKLEGGQDDFFPQVDLIRQEADVLRDMVSMLSGKKGTAAILERITLLDQLEQKGDDVRHELLGTLYNSEREIRDLLIRRDIYDMLEKVVDRFRNVAGVAMQIVLKNS